MHVGVECFGKMNTSAENWTDDLSVYIIVSCIVNTTFLIIMDTIFKRGWMCFKEQWLCNRQT